AESATELTLGTNRGHGRENTVDGDVLPDLSGVAIIAAASPAAILEVVPEALAHDRAPHDDRIEGDHALDVELHANRIVHSDVQDLRHGGEADSLDFDLLRASRYV